MSRIVFFKLIERKRHFEKRIYWTMLLSMKKAEPLMNIRQFEQKHQLSVVHWLIEKKRYRQKEAEYFSRQILKHLKEHCCPKKPYQLSVIWQIIHKFTQQELLQANPSILKNFGLTEDTFNAMLKELHEGKDALYESVFLSHFDDCMSYLKRNYNASHEDAYDASMESMLEFMKRLKAGKITYGNLRFLFTQMAGQIYLKWIKKEQKRNQLEQFDLGAAPEVMDEEDLKILAKAWNGLCDHCSQLLKQFYYEGVALKLMAEELGKPAATLRKQKQRCIEKLRNLFVEHS